MRKFILLISLLLASLNVAAGQMYRWVDAEGKVHYTDEPPPASAKQVQQKKLTSGGSDEQALPYAVQVASKKFPVTLYVFDCGETCDQARNHLLKRGVPFTAKDPSKNKEDRAALQQLTSKLEVPVLVVGSNVSSGYQASAWDTLLDAAGYPKSSQLPKAPAAKPASPPAEEKAGQKAP